jgi:hypothetical protein
MFISTFNVDHPNAGDDALRHYFTRNLHDHTLAAVTNIMNEPPPYFERAVHYDRYLRLWPRASTRLRAQESMAMLLRLNKIAHQALQDDPGGDSRWIAGIYVMPQAVKPEPAPVGDVDKGGDE